MPTQESAVQERGFRSSLFGFDKNDVLAYMNTLANEARQQELEYQEQLRQLQAQVDKLKTEQGAARACVDKLQNDLSAAEAQRAEAQQRLEEEHKRADDLQARCREGEKTLREWQFKCHDLQQQLEAAQKAVQEAAARPAPEAEPAPPAPQEDLPLTARIEARKILADARLYAENAERRLQQQAQEQQERMAEHARGIAAGVLLLRSRLARVDDRISGATLDLENATASIYQALDQTDADLDALNKRLHAFDDPEEEPAAEDAPAARPRVTAQAVPQTHRRAAAAGSNPGGRLRRSVHGSRPVSEELLRAMDHFPQD